MTPRSAAVVGVVPSTERVRARAIAVVAIGAVRIGAADFQRDEVCYAGVLVAVATVRAHGHAEEMLVLPIPHGRRRDTIQQLAQDRCILAVRHADVLADG